MEPKSTYRDVLEVSNTSVPVRKARVRAAAEAIWNRAIDRHQAPPEPEKPMSAGEWLRISQQFLFHDDAWRWSPPTGGMTLRLSSGLYVKVLRLTPRERHVHYQVLGHKGYRWMKLRQFLMEATVAGHFKRAPSGELVWIEPKEPAHAPD
jgi:hypothetical protein